MKSANHHRGFTLIEVLVAFTIAATSIGLLFQIHGRATATIVIAEESLYAIELARSLIDEYSATIENLAFRREGVDAEKYRWTVSASEFADPTAVDSSPKYNLRDIRVVVTWMSRTGERALELHTVKPYAAPAGDN